MTSTANRLYQWMTDEMSVLPFKKATKDKTPLNVADMEFLVQGQGEKLWSHVEKHVYSRKKVDKIRKNILINRLKATDLDEEIHKKDYVGKQMKSLLELRSIRSAIDEKRLAIDNIEEECKQVNLKHKVSECKRQLLTNQSDDIERRILLLQLAEDTIASKVHICQSSDKFFVRFKSDNSRDLDSSQIKSSVRSNETRSGPSFALGENNEDSDLRSKAGCLGFLGKCTTVAKVMVEEKCKDMSIGSHYKSLHLDSFSSMRHSILIPSTLTSTPLIANECAIPKFEAKKNELRKHVSENMLQVQPQLLHELLIRQTSKGIASMGGCHSEDGFKDGLRLLGTKNDTAHLKAELDKKFNDLYFETTYNMISCARERNITARAEQALSSLMAQVEKQLKEIFTIQAAMVGKAYELVKVEAEIASLKGAASYKEEFIQEKNSDVISYSNGLKELHMPDEAKLIKSMGLLKNFRESIMKIVMKNHSEFQMIMEDMKAPGFLRKICSFIFEGGLISQEIMPFTCYPLEYHANTNVCGKLIPDFKLLNNGFCWQNFVSLGTNASDNAFFDQCIQATMGHIPHCSPETILLAAFKSKLFHSEADDTELSKLHFDDNLIRSHLSQAQELSSKLQRNEEMLEKDIRISKETDKSYYKQTNTILDEAEFLLKHWCDNVIIKCVPKSIVYEGKPYQQWQLDFLAALYNTKST